MNYQRLLQLEHWPDDQKPLLLKMNGVESLIQPFMFQLTFLEPTQNPVIARRSRSNPCQIKLRAQRGTQSHMNNSRGFSSDNILTGKTISWSINHINTKSRIFSGYISQYSHDKQYLYITVRPLIWFLEHEITFRQFTNKNIIQILEQIIYECGWTDDIKLHITKTYQSMKYYCQHNEATLDFITRIMRENHLFFLYENNITLITDNLQQGQPGIANSK